MKGGYIVQTKVRIDNLAIIAEDKECGYSIVLSPTAQSVTRDQKLQLAFALFGVHTMDELVRKLKVASAPIESAESIEEK